ncbi:ATP-binding protein [uncultured Mobiluncus sp.]|uniref:ATP-binding protein n=1 Tax=uncultured Mobiluncus sp. TaxID=293425 RepID=UPI00343C594B
MGRSCICPLSRWQSRESPATSPVLIITSNLPFSQWGEILGSTTIATAIIDRVVHHAQVLQTSGKSYRLRNHDRPNPVK